MATERIVTQFLAEEMHWRPEGKGNDAAAIGGCRHPSPLHSTRHAAPLRELTHLLTRA